MMSSQLVIQAKEIHAVSLPEQVLGGLNDLNGSHRCPLLMRTQDPPLSGQAGRVGDIGADKERPVSWALGICQVGAQLLSASCFFLFLVE